MTLGLVAYNQDATYWAAPVQNGFGGFSFAAPVTIKVRWEEMIETFTDSEGTEKKSKAKVFTINALDEGGYLMKGISVAADPTVISGPWEIQRVDSIPDLRGLHQTNKAYL